MNFLEIARATRLLSGMQGSGPASVETAQGAEAALVQFVKDAYVDIQNTREDWKWMELSDSFTTLTGKSTYTYFDIFVVAAPAHKKYQKNSFIITKSDGTKTYMQEYTRGALEAKYLNSISQQMPTEYAIDPSSQSVIVKPTPDGIYTIDFRYQSSPIILSTDGEVPALPSSFHNLIVYKAVEKMAVYLSNPEAYRQYSFESAKMMGQLMRLELPKMRMNARSLV